MKQTIESKNKRETAAFGGCTLMVIGILLCFTGIGAIIGVPLILASIVLPFVNLGNASIVGNCPYCRHQTTEVKYDVGHTYKACWQMIIIRNGNCF